MTQDPESTKKVLDALFDGLEMAVEHVTTSKKLLVAGGQAKNIEALTSVLKTNEYLVEMYRSSIERAAYEFPKFKDYILKRKLGYETETIDQDEVS